MDTLVSQVEAFRRSVETLKQGRYGENLEVDILQREIFLDEAVEIIRKLLAALEIKRLS